MLGEVLITEVSKLWVVTYTKSQNTFKHILCNLINFDKCIPKNFTFLIRISKF